MDKNTLRETVLDQRESFEKKRNIILRDVPRNFVTSKKISVISGIRRSGKSTLLKQISHDMPQYAYLNFEDERMLDFTHADFNLLLEVFLELYGDCRVFLFDEIQNIFGWEKFVRRLFEDGKKIFITGSNAKLLSSELATTLSGRHVKAELFPFSFREYLTCKKFVIKSHYTTREKVALQKHVAQYMKYGGFPETVIDGRSEELRQLYQDVLMNDLMVRFKIRETKAFRDVALFLLSNISTPISFNNVRNLLGIKSVTSVKNYIDFFEEAYLFYTLSKFDYSVKKQIVNDRKIYCVDTGIVNAVAFRFSDNIGRMMENMVYIALRRKGDNVFYHKDKRECDFVIRTGIKITEAIQVTASLAQVQTEKREIEGLVEAMEKYDISHGTIIAFDEEREYTVQGKTIKVIPLWKWLLKN